jgi:hypothetical protein
MVLTPAAGDTLAWATHPRHAKNTFTFNGKPGRQGSATSISTMYVRTLIMRAASPPGRSTISYHNSMLQTAGPRRLGFSGTFGRNAANDRDRGYDLADPADRVFAFDYEHSGRLGDPMPGLLLPATTAGRIDGEPIEDVLLARDDVAALAWGIEHVVAGAAGRPLDRAQAAAERRRRADLAAVPPSAPTRELRYCLATEVPENWYPLLPKQAGLRAIEYQLGEAHLGPNPTPMPLGSVLGGSILLSIQEEELYRPRLHVRRLARRVRRSDGSVGVWLGRRTGPGRGESGKRAALRFG